MSSFEQTIDDSALQSALQHLEQRGTNLRPALLGIGEAWIGLVKATFATSTSPFGDKWAPNAAATYSAQLAKFAGSYSKKTGRLTATGARRVMNKKPLIGETRQLSTTIYKRVDGNTLTVGSPMAYAAIQQWGGKAGRGKKVTIPSRKFMPIDDTGNLAPNARRVALAELEDYLKP